MKSESQITCERLAALLEHARQVGTVSQWCALALEWAAKADQEIRLTRAALADMDAARRETFVRAAMQGLCASAQHFMPHGPDGVQLLARLAVEIADATIAEMKGRS